MSDKKILFICEGSVDEPELLKALVNKVLPSKIKYSIYSYNTTIHDLAMKLERLYPDFDKKENEINIALVLRDMEKDMERRNLLSNSYSDIILAFDFDPHHRDSNFSTVRRMLAFFTDSADMGKLYINYPMIESYRHLKDIPDESYIGKLVSPLRYKEKVDNESVMKSLRKYTYPDFMYITSLNLRAAMFLLTKENRIPTKIEYLSLNWDEIYDIELDTFRKTESVYPLNTLLFFPIDYAPSVFFNQIKSHPDKFT